MNIYKLLLVFISATFIQSCGVLPFKKELSQGHARVENWQETAKERKKAHLYWRENNIDRDKYPYTKRTLDKLFVMCNDQMPRGFIEAYHPPAGKHKLWVKAIINQKEADILFDVSLKSGGNYGFKNKVYDDFKQVDVWMVDLATGEPVSDIYVLALTTFRLNRYRATWPRPRKRARWKKAPFTTSDTISGP